MPNDLEMVTSIDGMVRSSCSEPISRDTEPRTAKDGIGQSWKPSWMANFAYACAAHICEDSRCSAPPPTSNEGSGSQMPLRAKMPMVSSALVDLTVPSAQLDDSSVAHQ